MSKEIKGSILKKLPSDLIYLSFYFLEPLDLTKLVIVSTSWKQIVHNFITLSYGNVWKNKYEEFSKDLAKNNDVKYQQTMSSLLEKCHELMKYSFKCARYTIVATLCISSVGKCFPNLLPLAGKIIFTLYNSSELIIFSGGAYVIGKMVYHHVQEGNKKKHFYKNQHALNKLNLSSQTFISLHNTTKAIGSTLVQRAAPKTNENEVPYQLV